MLEAEGEQNAKIFLFFVAGFLFGCIVSAFVLGSMSYDKTWIKPLLIKEKCAEYDSTTGEFVIHNLLIENDKSRD